MPQARISQRTRDKIIRGLLANKLKHLSAVYAVGPKSGTPLKIGYSTQPKLRLGQIKVDNWEEIKFHIVGWVDCEVKAKIVEQNCHRILDKAGKTLRGEWFDITPEWAAKVMDHVAAQWRYRLISHRQLLKKFQESKDPLAGDFWGGVPGEQEAA